MNGRNGFKSLIYAVRLPVLARLGGRLALMLAVSCLPVLLVAAGYGEYKYLPAIGLVMLPLLLVARLTRRMPEPRHLMRSEGFVVTTAAFVLTPVLMSFTLLPSGLPWLDCLFETVSAITTTGLSTAPHISSMDKTFLFIRAWMQWYGGLGIVVLSVSLLMQRSLAAYQLLEVPEGTGFVSAVTFYARRILTVYIVLTLLAVLVCWVCFEDAFLGLVHGFSAISTGGFATRDDSLASLPFAAQVAVMIVSCAGALSLAVYLQVRQLAWRQILQNEELRAFFVVLLLVCSLLVVLGIKPGAQPAGAAFETGIIMGISALSTTGFASVNVADLGADYKLLLMMAMFIGGCVGSTAGGFKIFRVLVVWQLLLATLRRASAAQHAVIEPRLQGRSLTQDQIQMAMLIGSLLLGLCLASWAPFLYYGYDPVNALFEVVSSVGTVGLSAGVTNQSMPALLKAVLCVDMIAGRVEVIALVCVFYPGLWLGHRNPEL